MFIIDDERDDVMAKAFFYHNESADSTVIVLEGMDLFEPCVETGVPILFKIICLICAEICNKILITDTHILRRYCIG